MCVHILGRAEQVLKCLLKCSCHTTQSYYESMRATDYRPCGMPFFKREHTLSFSPFPLSVPHVLITDLPLLPQLHIHTHTHSALRHTILYTLEFLFASPHLETLSRANCMQCVQQPTNLHTLSQCPSLPFPSQLSPVSLPLTHTDLPLLPQRVSPRQEAPGLLRTPARRDCGVQ